MTDTDAPLRNRLRWAIHGLLVVGLALILLLVTLGIAAGGYTSDPKSRLEALAATWGFFIVYAAGTTFLVAWKATTWLHALLMHAAAVGAIVVGIVAIAVCFVVAR